MASKGSIAAGFVLFTLIFAGIGGMGDPPPLPQCSDGIDNNSDGSIDITFDAITGAIQPPPVSDPNCFFFDPMIGDIPCPNWDSEFARPSTAGECT